jgi:hypothetical protein
VVGVVVSLWLDEGKFAMLEDCSRMAELFWFSLMVGKKLALVALVQLYVLLRLGVASTTWDACKWPVTSPGRMEVHPVCSSASDEQVSIMDIYGQFFSS